VASVDELKKCWKVTAFFAVGMIASVLVYAVVAEVIKRSGPAPGFSGDREQEQMLRMILFAVAIGDALFSFIIKGVLLKSGAGLPPGMDENLVVPVLTQKLQTSTIVVMAICESVAIIGLVLFILTRQTGDMYILMALSLSLFFFHFPRLDRWQEFITENQTASIIGRGKI
jgi:hypothetical protein